MTAVFVLMALALVFADGDKGTACALSLIALILAMHWGMI